MDTMLLLSEASVSTLVMHLSRMPAYIFNPTKRLTTKTPPLDAFNMIGFHQRIPFSDNKPHFLPMKRDELNENEICFSFGSTPWNLLYGDETHLENNLDVRATNFMWDIDNFIDTYYMSQHTAEEEYYLNVIKHLGDKDDMGVLKAAMVRQRVWNVSDIAQIDHVWHGGSYGDEGGFDDADFNWSCIMYEPFPCLIQNIWACGWQPAVSRPLIFKNADPDGLSMVCSNEPKIMVVFHDKTEFDSDMLSNERKSGLLTIDDNNNLYHVVHGSLDECYVFR